MLWLKTERCCLRVVVPEAHVGAAKGDLLGDGDIDGRRWALRGPLEQETILWKMMFKSSHLAVASFTIGLGWEPDGPCWGNTRCCN